MKEYGNAISIRLDHPREAPEEIVESAKRMLQFNYTRTREAHPEWGLPEQWRFLHRPGEQVWEIEECRACHGDGAWWEYGTLDDPDDAGAEVKCSACNGLGSIPVKPMEPPMWNHYFGWYVIVES